MQLSNEQISNIITKIFMGESYRPYIMTLKNEIYAEIYKDVISKIKNKPDSNFEEVFLDNQHINDKLWFSGVPHKTVDDTYGGKNNENKIRGLNELGDENKRILVNSETSLENVIFKFDDGIEAVYPVEEFLRLLLGITTLQGAKRGGFNSSMGKRVEKIFLVTLCKLFGVSNENYHPYDLDDGTTHNRETDFYLINNNGDKFKIEFKLMGKGNPESADSFLARNTNITIGETLSETNKAQLDANNIYWVELKNGGWKKFEEILNILEISNSFSDENVNNLDEYITESINELDETSN